MNDNVRVYHIDEYCEGASHFSFSARKDVVLLEDYEKLQAENERLKGELQQSATNCNKLRCLALHGMFGYACAKMNVLVEKPDYKYGSGKIHKDFSRWNRLCRLWLKAYRKAKKDLREGK